ncbi:MAG: bifunctional adenosylcobinamide kinase/adenosylcobinamide-phosphate guanylyltransferase [Pseudomonadota bacterium]
MNAAAALAVARSELVLGGQKSGKSRRAESLAAHWLAASPAHRAVFIATAHAGDGEMHERIARHRADRARRLPGMATVEEPLRLAEAIVHHSHADTLVVVDCLTLWLTNCIYQEPGTSPAPDLPALLADVAGAITQAPGPLVLVSNEIGLGVVPLGREVRAFVDALGQLNQHTAAACARVTLMAAGLPLTLKDSA